MLPAAGLEIPGARAFRDFDPAGRTRDLADAFELNSIDSPWQPRHVLRLYREQQLKIFTTMECELKRIERTTPAKFHDPLINRQQRRIDQRSNLARFAQMIEIRRQTIAEIDHRSRQPFLVQHGAAADAWLTPK